MKILIISDLHLNHTFDKRKYLYLEDLFSSVDQIILNGDFWDAYRTTFARFITSPWKQLFPLLKKKNTIYIHGNHDKKRFSNNQVSLFSIEQKDKYILTMDRQTYHIEHGHLLKKTIDEIFPLSLKILYYINNTVQRFESILTRIGSPHNIFLKNANTEIKKKLRDRGFSNWYLCGHTHYAEIDKENKFANSGFIQFGKASYLIIDSSGLSLQTESYK